MVFFRTFKKKKPLKNHNKDELFECSPSAYGARLDGTLNVHVTRASREL